MIMNQAACHQEKKPKGFCFGLAGAKLDFGELDTTCCLSLCSLDEAACRQREHGRTRVLLQAASGLHQLQSRVKSAKSAEGPEL